MKALVKPRQRRGILCLGLLAALVAVAYGERDLKVGCQAARQEGTRGADRDRDPHMNEGLTPPPPFVTQELYMISLPSEANHGVVMADSG
jgi:hypothetical protein